MLSVSTILHHRNLSYGSGEPAQGALLLFLAKTRWQTMSWSNSKASRRYILVAVHSYTWVKERLLDLYDRLKMIHTFLLNLKGKEQEGSPCCWPFHVPESGSVHAMRLSFHDLNT